MDCLKLFRQDFKEVCPDIRRSVGLIVMRNAIGFAAIFVSYVEGSDVSDRIDDAVVGNFDRVGIYLNDNCHKPVFVRLAEGSKKRLREKNLS